MEFFQNLNIAPLQVIAPEVKRFVFSLNNLMLTYFELAPGTRISRHSHPHEQMGILIKGKLVWRMAERETLLEAPALYRVPSGEPHEVEVVGEEPVIVMDAFSPVREDFLEKEAPSYMK